MNKTSIDVLLLYEPEQVSLVEARIMTRGRFNVLALDREVELKPRKRSICVKEGPRQTRGEASRARRARTDNEDYVIYAPQADISMNFTCLPDTVDPHEAEASLRRAHARRDFTIR
jgi:hypothetical protein